MRSANPALNDQTFDVQRSSVQTDDRVMSIRGTVQRTAILLVLALASASFPWASISGGSPSAGVYGWILGGLFAGLLFALLTVFRKEWSPYTAPLYALAEGLFLGGISAVFELQFPGIVIQAVGLTFGVAFALLLAYTSGLIRATENFKLGVAAATGGIFLVYLASFVLGFFGVSVPYLHDSGPVGIGISLVIVTVAALNLVLDFDFIEQGVERGAPKYMEWYAAFGLVVTLVWLYLEMLRLLAKIQSRD